MAYRQPPVSVAEAYRVLGVQNVRIQVWREIRFDSDCSVFLFVV